MMTKVEPIITCTYETLQGDYDLGLYYGYTMEQREKDVILDIVEQLEHDTLPVTTTAQALFNRNIFSPACSGAFAC